MTRTPRTELSPDTIKLIVRILTNSLRTLQESPYRNTQAGVCVQETIKTVIDACTEESKS